MQIPFSATIRYDDEGPALDIECTVDACLEWEGGEPAACVTDVYLDGHSMYRAGPVFRTIAAMVAEEAEQSEGVLSAILVHEDVYFSGAPGNPSSHWVRA